ncbi:ABC transporter ATP-binding protein [Mangrovibacterium diazotrophicum]|uniref:Putative ABC transport system ATP-binding protein n=1 Tax=Mangrovibacterium diazotrophicum TaxID=1261403 RepID=A0A419W8C9_9BACT|nr:ABC transporter ATP-binding protein [Mangrovibacterium diazotrophicum]RKD91705.1 putative ABC transport system ATP-binding protein [Mangrovibacterium diazotrophicum]
MIRFKNVSLTLGNKQLLEQFNLNIAKGDKVVISAPSGAGKSTLLKLLLGFFEPDEGRILFNQKELRPENMRLIRSQIGYLSQDIDLPNGKVEEVFDEIFHYAVNRNINYSRDMLIEKIREVNLKEDILAKNTIDISGGERQRLGWILVMLLNRPVLLLDEPTSALDEAMKNYFVDYIKQTKKTVICSSHDKEWHTEPMRIITNLRS